jgi:Aromatic acid exporter family member 1
MFLALIQRIRSVRPGFSHIARLTATATFAYLLALVIPAGTSRPVLAPLTALLVLQASLYQTIRSGLRKVASVTAGVLVAVGVAEFIGFSWWQLALVIAAALLIGSMLRLGDDLLEVPISAMLIFASAGSHAAAAGRVVDTLVGTAAGLAGGLVFAAPRVQPAREAVGELAGQLADLLGAMAGDLVETRIDPDRARVAEWLTRARELRDQIERVDDTLRQVADSVRLNPRSRLRRGRLRPARCDLLVTEAPLRGGVEALEHATVTVRGLARSILDSADIESDLSPVRDERARATLADVLGNLAAAIRIYGRLMQASPSDSGPLESELAAQLEAALREQDELAAVLEPRVPAGGGSSEWPLRGEILTHVDRLRTGLRPDAVVRPDLARPPTRSRMRGPRRPSGKRDAQVVRELSSAQRDR